MSDRVHEKSHAHIPSTFQIFGILALLALPTKAWTQEGWDEREVRMTEVREGVFLLGNAGGNIAAFLGEDGVLLVDSGFGEMAEKVIDTVSRLAKEAGTPSSIRYVVNTHWHYDHTLGNVAMAQAGAVIFAHERAAHLMSEDRVLPTYDEEVAATPSEGRPVVTFSDRINLTCNGDVIHMVHMPLAHSDGDIIVHFRGADVVHLGDLVFNGTYPHIDVDFGGNLQGMIRAIQEVLDHTNESTLFIPGHGPPATRIDLVEYLEMLHTFLQRVETLVAEGLDRAGVIAARPTADLDGRWAPEGAGIDPDFMVGLVFDGVVGRRSGG